MNHFITFIHIEKAAGITLHNMLHRDFMGYISPSPAFDEFLSNEKLQKIMNYYPIKVTGVGGHRIATFLDFENVVKQPIFYFTIIRDPISRYMSHYNWQVNVMKKEWTLDSFTNETYFNNFQCYRISGKRTFEETLPQLEKLSFVGLFEKFRESVFVLSKMIEGFSPYFELSNLKDYGKAKENFKNQSGSLQQKIIQNNLQDIKLYDYVKDVVFPQFLQMIDDRKAFEIYTKINADYEFGKMNLLKRKISNKLLSNIIQPLIK